MGPFAFLGILQNATAFDWLTLNWRSIVPPLCLGPLLACGGILCGALVGEERAKHEKPAGMRTLMLVCLGSAVFTMASFIFTGASGDSGRIVAQIVSGVGFLGAGVIMRERGTISGTTTAATIWVVAALGIVVGSGYVGAAVCLSILIRFVLVGITLYEYHVAGELRSRTVEFDFDPDAGRTRIALDRVLADFQSSAVTTKWEEVSDEVMRLTLCIRLPHRAACELLADLAEVKQVKTVRELSET
jgi:putative Mg2+ transporter-C (MgtC) family protein